MASENLINIDIDAVTVDFATSALTRLLHDIPLQIQQRMTIIALNRLAAQYQRQRSNRPRRSIRDGLCRSFGYAVRPTPTKRTSPWTPIIGAILSLDLCAMIPDALRLSAAAEC